jgi:putative NADH-flavin reductase
MEERMNLVVFGASRGVGRSLTELALDADHHLTAVVRNPSALELNHDALDVVAGDVTDAGSVRQFLRGHDVAFCTVGADQRGATTLYSTAARNLCSAIVEQGSGRLIFLSNFGVLGEKGLGARTAAVAFMAKRLIRPTLDDHRRALDHLREHDWDWIAVRPMQLTDGPRTGQYRVDPEGLPKGGVRISRADVADFMLKQVASNEYVPPDSCDRVLEPRSNS